MENLDYALGIVIADNLRGLGIEQLDGQQFLAGLTDVLSGKKPQIDETRARTIVAHYIEEQEKKRSEHLRTEGEKFLSENGKRPGVTTTASGLQYEVLTSAIGRKPVATSTVRCHYEGRLTDGTVFDSSYRRGEPAEFPLSGVIAGWTEGLQLMSEGAKFRFFIPQNLGYGARGAGGSIPPYAALVFDVELIKVL